MRRVTTYLLAYGLLLIALFHIVPAGGFFFAVSIFLAGGAAAKARSVAPIATVTQRARKRECFFGTVIQELVGGRSKASVETEWRSPASSTSVPVTRRKSTSVRA